MRKKRWTKEEDNLLIKLVQDNLDNIHRGCVLAAKKLNRTIPAAEYRWYYVLTNPENKHYIGSTCFIGFSRSRKFVNRKIYIEGKNRQKPEKSTADLWNKILKLLKFK